MGMHGNCGILSGLFVLVGGLALLSYGLMWLDAYTASLVAGVFIALFGVMKLTHSMGMCGDCNAARMKMMKGKK